MLDQHSSVPLRSANAPPLKSESYARSLFARRLIIPLLTLGIVSSKRNGTLWSIQIEYGSLPSYRINFNEPSSVGGLQPHTHSCEHDGGAQCGTFQNGCVQNTPPIFQFGRGSVGPSSGQLTLATPL